MQTNWASSELMVSRTPQSARKSESLSLISCIPTSLNSSVPCFPGGCPHFARQSELFSLQDCASPLAIVDDLSEMEGLSEPIIRVCAFGTSSVLVHISLEVPGTVQLFLCAATMSHADSCLKRQQCSSPGLRSCLDRQRCYLHVLSPCLERQRFEPCLVMHWPCTPAWIEVLLQTFPLVSRGAWAPLNVVTERRQLWKLAFLALGTGFAFSL